MIDADKRRIVSRLKKLAEMNDKDEWQKTLIDGNQRQQQQIQQQPSSYSPLVNLHNDENERNQVEVEEEEMKSKKSFWKR